MSTIQDFYKLDLLERGNWFTLDSAFNNPCRDYGLSTVQDVERIWDQFTEFERSTMALDFVFYGLQVLGDENPNEHIRLAACRVRDQYAAARLHYRVVTDPAFSLEHEFGLTPGEINETLLAPDAPAYLTGPYGDQIILLSRDWLASTVTRPLQALTYLLSAASLARDDYFGLLRGTYHICVPGVGEAEIPCRDHCTIRAQSLMSELLNQALENDQLIFHIPPRTETVLYQIRDRVTRASEWTTLMYSDPETPPASSGGEAPFSPIA